MPVRFRSARSHLLLAAAGVLAVLALGSLLREASRRSPATSAASPAPRVTPAQATARALNRLSPADGGYTLVHPRHTAHFTATGLDFRARRGPRWGWSLQAAGPAGAVRPVAPVAPVAGDLVVRYVRPGLEERYRLQASCVEQDFVLGEAAVRRGVDFVIEGAVACAGRFTAEARGWTWRDAAGVVSLGHVRVVDASGRELAARMDVDAAATRITVDGAALASATYPVTIDPEIGTNDFRVSAMGPDGDETYDGRNNAVAYNATNQEYLVVWEGDDDTPGNHDGEFEIFAQRVSATTGLAVGANDFRVSDMGVNGDTNADAIDPAVAWNATRNEYLVVWAGDDSAGVTANGESEIFGQRLAGATGAEVGANDFRVSDMGVNGSTTNDARTPAVAYGAGPGQYLVVWAGDDGGAMADGEYEIFGQRLTASTGVEVGTNDFRVSDMGFDGDATLDAEDPAVAFATGENHWLVVWSGDDNTGKLVEGEREIYGQMLDGTTGAPLGTNDARYSAMGPDGDPTYDAFDPAVAYLAGTHEFLLVWSGDTKGGSLTEGEYEILGQRVNAASGAESGSDDFKMTEMGIPGHTNVGAFAPAVVAKSSGATEYFVTWHADQDTLGLVNEEFEVYGQRLTGSQARETGVDDMRLSDMGPDGDIDYDARFPQVAYNPFDAEYLVVWEADDTTGTLVDGETEIFARRVSAVTGAPLGPLQFRVSAMGPDGDPAYDAQDAAVAFDTNHHEWLVVWAGETNAGGRVNGEFEIHGQRLDAQGQAVGADDFRISDMGPDGDALYDAAHPRVAYDANDDQFLVVWDGDDDAAGTVEGEVEIWGQRLDWTGAELGANDFRISSMGPDSDPLHDAGKPAVAHDPVHDQYLVVWAGDDVGPALVEGEDEIFGQLLSGDGLEVGADDFRVSDMGPALDPLFDAASPAVAWVPGEQQWFVTWDADDEFPLIDGETEIFGQLLEAVTGAEVDVNDFRLSNAGPDGSGTYDASHPAIAHSPAYHRSLVVWMADDTTGARAPSEYEITAQAFATADLLAAPPAARAGFALAVRGPNPARGTARFELAADAPGEFDLSTFDVSGRRVARQTVAFAAPGRAELTLDTRGLAPGVYLVRATSARRQAVTKLVVAR